MSRTEEFWPGVLATADQLDQRSYYELLGLTRDASPDAIGQAYYAQVRRLHPDRHAMESDTERKNALVRVYARIGEAYRVLTSPEKRKVYDQGLDSGQTRLTHDRQVAAPRPTATGPTHPQAKALFERGKTMMAQGDKRGARAQWDLAIQFDPESEAIRNALATLDTESALPLPAEGGAARSPGDGHGSPDGAGNRATAPAGAGMVKPGNHNAQPSWSSRPMTEFTVPGPSLQQGVPQDREPSEPRASDGPAPVPIPCSTWDKVEALYLHKIQGEGMAIRSAYAPPVGTAIPLAIQLPDGNAIQLATQVVSVGPARKPGRWSIRLAFAELSVESREFFEKSLERHGKQWSEELVVPPVASTSPPPPGPSSPPLPATSPSPAPSPPPLLSPPATPDEPARIHSRRLETESSSSPVSDDSDTDEMDASMLAEELFDVLPEDAPILEDDAALGRRALSERRYAMACDHLGRALERDPDNDAVRALFYVAVGHQTEATGNIREAQIHVQTALKLDASAIEWLK